MAVRRVKHNGLVTRAEGVAVDQRVSRPVDEHDE